MSYINLHLYNSKIIKNKIKDNKSNSKLKKYTNNNRRINTNPITILFISIAKFTIYLVKFFYKFCNIFILYTWPKFRCKKKFGKRYLI